MGNKSSRAKGKAEEISGAVKKKIGKMTGDEEMEIEGAVTEFKGQARQEIAKAAERNKGAAEEIAGTVKKHVGRITDDKALTAKGKLEEIKGKARQKINE